MAAMNDHWVPLSVSSCLFAVLVIFRGCFQFITEPYVLDTQNC